MIGRLFVEVAEDRIAVTGVVKDKVGEGLYLLEADGKPPVGRVVAAARLQNFFFFDTIRGRNEWIQSHTKPAEPEDKGMVADELMAEIDNSLLEAEASE